MKKIAVVVFLMFFIGAAWAKKGVRVVSDTEGKDVTVTITKQNWSIDCHIKPSGWQMTSLYIGLKNAACKDGYASISAYFDDNDWISMVHYGYYCNTQSFSAYFSADKADDYPVIYLIRQVVNMLYQKYDLARLARVEAKRKQAEYRASEEAKRRQAAEWAKKRPNAADILEKILKSE